MELGLQGKRAAVAAGSAGLGLGVARALVRKGARVVICGRDQARLADAAASLDSPDVVTVVADVGSTEGATAFIVEATERLGGLDIVVPNAGGPPAGSFASTDLDAYPEALALNLLSTVAMCKAAVPAMCDQGWGRVVAITSMTVRQPSPALILSNTARAGATAFLKTLATEVARRGVTVNSLQPGLHLTDRLAHLGVTPEQLISTVPMHELGDPDDFGAIAAFLCSDHARFVTGVAIPVDGGAFSGLQ